MKTFTKLVLASILFLCLFSYAETDCKTPVEKSSAIIIYLLVDINKTYSFTSGGGISEIKEIATGIYRISLSQEERIDQIQYQVKIDKKCKVTILKKEEMTKSLITR